MQFSSRTTIATHIMICLDYFKEDYKLTSEFLAESIQVNPVIIRKTLGQLKKANLVHVEAGVGGATLAREAADITLYDIYQAVEKQEPLFHFHEHPNEQCPVGSHIHEILDDKLDFIQQQMASSMKTITLAQLIEEAKGYNHES